MDAHLHISGNVGKDIDFYEASGGKDAWATFRLAHTPSYRRGDAWIDHPTTWLKVTCQRMLAENVQASIRVGDRVMVHGRLQTEQWVDQKTGEVRENQILKADAVGLDLRFGSTGRYRKNPKRDAKPTTEPSGRGGEDPWSSGQQQSSGQQSSDEQVDGNERSEPESDLETVG